MPPLKTHPTHVPGYVPGKEFADAIRGLYLKLAVITRVDDVTMKADLKIVTGGGERFEIDLTQAMAGPRSFWGGIPEVDSLAVVGFRKKHKQIEEVVILGYLPVGTKSGGRFDPYAPDDPANIAPEDASLYAKIIGRTTRYKRLRLRSGDVGGMSAAGSELVLSKDARMVNRAGDAVELRDAERTAVIHSVHKVESASGVKRLAGPIRRFDAFLPPDVLDSSGKLKGEADRYFGRDELAGLGPGLPGAPTKFAQADGTLNPLFQNLDGASPPVVYANGRRAFYPSTVYGTPLEGGEAGPGDAFTEDRMEMRHQSDLSQDSITEIDGFPVQSARVYIEQVYGTLVGNDPWSSLGQRQYGKVLRPQIWTDIGTTKPGLFSLEEIDRAGGSDAEATTSAGAYLFRVFAPKGAGLADTFAMSVQKQGKVLIQVPKPTVERYPDARGVSLEANILGAIKMFIGAMSPTNTSIQATLAGGIKADIGHNSDTGNALDITYHSGVRHSYRGVPGDTDRALDIEIQGDKAEAVSGDSVETVEGTRSIRASNLLDLGGERVNLNATSGFASTAKDVSWVVAGQSQYRYGLLVQETIAAGGRVSTILAGSEVRSILAGAMTTTVAAGATAFNNPGGAFAVTVGAGALTLTTASGAVAISAAGGAVALTAGLAMTLTAGLAMTLTAAAAVSLIAPQILLGGPAAVLGIVRGAPTLPPGAPSLDYILGIPYLGSALARSF
jgi:hypothetical protein